MLVDVVPFTKRTGKRQRGLVAFLCCMFAAAFTFGQAKAEEIGCRANLSSSWSETEKAAWQSLARGDEFDARKFSPDRMEQRVIRPSFIRDILGCEELTESLSWSGVALKGVIIPGVLDLRLLDVAVRVSCEFCLLDKIDGRESRWRRSLILNDSKLQRGLDFVLARFDEEFHAQRLKSAAEIQLDQVSVNRNANFLGLQSLKLLSMRDGYVGEKLKLDGAQLEGLDLGGTRIGGQLILSGIRVGKKAVLDRMRIGGDLLLRTWPNGPKPEIGADYSLKDVQGLVRNGEYVVVLNNTRIGGRLEIAHARIKGPVTLDAIRVEEDIWLRECSLVLGHIQMPFARIGQNLDLSTTVLQSIDATGSTIGGELRLGAAGSAQLTAPVWYSMGQMILRNVSVSAWVDATGSGVPRSKNCPPVQAANDELDPWPPRIDIIGFSYDRAGGLGGGADRPEDWYVEWLARQVPFSLDPYRRLADYLLTNGRVAAANQVLYAGKERQLEESEALTRVLLFLQWIFVGYGIRTWYILAWVLGMILLGALIFSKSQEARLRNMPYCLAYSTETFLPFVELRKQHGEIDFAGRTRYYLYLHKLMGWVCSLFFVSALAGLFEV